MSCRFCFPLIAYVEPVHTKNEGHPLHLTRLQVIMSTDVSTVHEGTKLLVVLNATNATVRLFIIPSQNFCKREAEVHPSKSLNVARL